MDSKELDLVRDDLFMHNLNSTLSVKILTNVLGNNIDTNQNTKEYVIQIVNNILNTSLILSGFLAP